MTLSGGGQRRILYMNTCDEAQVWTTSHCQDQDHPRLTLQNLTFADGNSTGDATEGGGGGAIFVRGGRVKVVNSRFFRNRCDGPGPTSAAPPCGCSASRRASPCTSCSSTFGGAAGEGGECSNGGALSSIGVSWVVLNSVLSHNTAVGSGANPARAGTPGGGSGGAIYTDGNDFTLDLAGTVIEDNHANEGGGAVFFVSNDRTGTLTIDGSTLRRNPSDGFETPGFPGIFFLGSGSPVVVNSTIEDARASTTLPAAHDSALSDDSARAHDSARDVASNRARRGRGAGVDRPLDERAWRTAGTELLDELFTEDASYQTAPFHQPHVGIDAYPGELWDGEREGPDEAFAQLRPTSSWSPIPACGCPPRGALRPARRPAVPGPVGDGLRARWLDAGRSRSGRSGLPAPTAPLRADVPWDGDSVDFEEAVAAVLDSLRPGEVVTYGEVAAEAGRPARPGLSAPTCQVRRPAPWWRVVTTTGRLVPGFEQEHARRLRAEGTEVRDGRVPMRGERMRNPHGVSDAGRPPGGA